MSFLDAKSIIENIFKELEGEDVIDIITNEDDHENVRIAVNIFNAGCSYDIETFNYEDELEHEDDDGRMIFFLSIEDAQIAIEKNNIYYQEYRKSKLN